MEKLCIILLFVIVIITPLFLLLKIENSTQHYKITNHQKVEQKQKKQDDRFMEFGYQFGPHLGWDGQMRMLPGIGYNVFGW